MSEGVSLWYSRTYKSPLPFYVSAWYSVAYANRYSFCGLKIIKIVLVFLLVNRYSLGSRNNRHNQHKQKHETLLQNPPHPR